MYKYACQGVYQGVGECNYDVLQNVMGVDMVVDRSKRPIGCQTQGCRYSEEADIFRPSATTNSGPCWGCLTTVLVSGHCISGRLLQGILLVGSSAEIL